MAEKTIQRGLTCKKFGSTMAIETVFVLSKGNEEEAMVLFFSNGTTIVLVKRASRTFRERICVFAVYGLNKTIAWYWKRA